ncbi:MAG: fimbrial protein, partial [Butyricimonas faecihominis]
MKNRMVLMLTLAAIVFVGCVNEKEDKSPVDGGVADVAYISLQVKTEKNEARSSGENAGMNESDLKTLYLITFDETEKVVGIPKTTEYYTKIENAASKPDAIKISAASEKLLVIANPGDKLLDVIENINDRTTFSTINAAVKEVTMAEITDKVDAIAKGFTMVNSGNESGKQAGDKITDPLISLVGKIQVVSKDLKEENAIEEAEKEGNRVDVKIERLASKVELKLKGDNNDNVVVEPTGATFTFKNWTLDVVNST